MYAGVGSPAFSQARLVATLSIPSRDAADPLPTNASPRAFENFLQLAALAKLPVKNGKNHIRRLIQAGKIGRGHIACEYVMAHRLEPSITALPLTRLTSRWRWAAVKNCDLHGNSICGVRTTTIQVNDFNRRGMR